MSSYTLADLVTMPDFNPATQNDRGDWGLHCVSDGTVTHAADGKPECRDHGAMNAVNSDRTLWRCLACGRGCYAQPLLSPRDALRAKVAAEHGVDIDAVTIDAPDEAFERLTILVNDNVNMSPKKLAAQAVHAALAHYGIAHGTVVVLGARPGQIRDQCDVFIRDAGVTELEPGTLTAGVRRGDQPR